MAEQFEVLTEALQTHATALHGFADRLSDAVQAARQVSMPADAYGMICQFLPPVLNQLQERGAEALRGSAEGMDTTASNVKSTAQEYAAVDDQRAAALHRIRNAW